LRAADLSWLPVDAVDSLLSSAALRVESDDAPFDNLLSLGPAFSPLLGDIQPAFLSPHGLFILLRHWAYPPEPA
jgi:hypothetical protein